MATCLVEDTGLPSIYCQTTNSMQSTQSSSLETMSQRCQFNFHMKSIPIDSTTLLKHQESTKKRPFNRSHTYNSKNDLTKRTTDNSCSIQAVSINHNNNETLIRPNTLCLNPITNHGIPHLRTWLSHPSTPPNSIFPIDEDTLSPLKFTSLPALTSSPNKRLRPETLTFTSTNLSIPVLTKTSCSSSSIIHFIDSPALADKLKQNVQILIFDCGSPIRHSENHIQNSILLSVSDKISRKRLKSNSSKHSPVDIKQLNECDSIILYDDTTDNEENLSAGVKCACEEIQRCLTLKTSPIFILKNSFNHFSNLYPNFCQSSELQSSTSIDSSSQVTPSLDFESHPMTHIIDGLFIGSESNARNLEELSSEQIRHIVNVTSHVPLYHSDQFHYCHIPADDTQKQDLLSYFDQAHTFIQHAIENNEKVLVHCVAGISRSPAIVIGFLMRYAHMTLNDAYEFVKNKRSIVSPNLNFMGQLLQYEKKLREHQ